MEQFAINHPLILPQKVTACSFGSKNPHFIVNHIFFSRNFYFCRDEE